MKKILVINQYYAPDYASTGQYACDICNGLVKAGFDVTVVTGQPSYSKNSPQAPSFEILNGVKVHRVSLGNVKGREDNRTRFKGYIRFLKNAWKKAKELLLRERFDFIITFHNPPFVGFLGALFAKKYRMKFIYIPHDIHPDVLVATGWKIPQPFILLWEVINKRIFKTAEKIIVLGEGMKENLVNNKKAPEKKIKIIPLWGKPELDTFPEGESIREELGIKKDELFFLYAGNMGILHPLDIIIDAMKDLDEVPVKILFIGDGKKREYLQNRVRKENLKNINFLPFQPWDKFVQILCSADACFVTIGAGLENLALPSRTFTFLSAGCPVITIMNPEADVAKIIKKHDCGWNVRNAEELKILIKDFLKDPSCLKTKGQKARKVYEKHFKKEKLIKAYLTLLSHTPGVQEKSS